MLKTLRNKIKSDKGFTLVELIVVIVILIILAAIAIPVVSKYIEDANQSKCTANARSAFLALNVKGSDSVAKGTPMTTLAAADVRSTISEYVNTLPNNSTFGDVTFTGDGAVEAMTYTEGNWRVTVTDGAFPANGATKVTATPPDDDEEDETP